MYMDTIAVAQYRMICLVAVLAPNREMEFFEPADWMKQHIEQSVPVEAIIGKGGRYQTTKDGLYLLYLNVSSVILLFILYTT